MKEKVLEALKSLPFAELVGIWNTYCNSRNDYDSRVGFNEDYELDDLWLAAKPSEIIRMLSYGDYHYSDDYYTINGYGYIVTFNGSLDEDNCPIDIDDIADWIVDNPELVEEFGLDIEIEEEDEDYE